MERIKQPEKHIQQGEQRLLPIDVLRGLIMVLMALDHASLFIARVHRTELWSMPLPHYQDGFSFLTRFVTHLCAPGFFFLMGVGMVLFAQSRRRMGWSEGRIISHFALRGALLIVLQLLVENVAWGLPFERGVRLILYFGVLYGLGSVMILWTPFLRLSTGSIGILSIIAISATQVLILSLEDQTYRFNPALRLLLIPGQSGIWRVLYPTIPWFGVTGLGLLFGRILFLHGSERVYRLALILGSVFLLSFLSVRTLGGFGNFHPPEELGWIDYLNVTKYPPSLAFLLLTLGMNLLLLGIFGRVETGLKRRGNLLPVFGRSALFFYIAHLYLYAVMGFAFPQGTTLPIMYPFWLLGLLILYPLCRWYGSFKQHTAPESVWRFF